MTAWSSLHARVHRLLQTRSPGGGALLPGGARVLVGVSGGQDSLCLLKLLVDLRPQGRWQLEAVHCDHRWRPDSGENAAFVAQLAQQWEVPCRMVRTEEVLGSEAAARQWRYDVFAALALESRCSYVLTGHTATDRAETLLYNLVRGSGADGMQALSWARPLSGTGLQPSHPEILLVRPLLGVTRAETAEFCRTSGIPVWEDSTNQDRAYARNRLRLDVMPYLQEHFNPGVERTLAQTAEILAAEVELLEHLTDALYQQAVEITPGKPSKVRRSPLKPAHRALQRRVLRRVLQQVVAAQVSFDHVEKLVKLIDAPNRSQSDPFPGGAIARVEQDFIIIE